MGKWAILRRHFLLIVLTFCIYLNQNVVKFQEQRPLASTSVQIQNANFPCAYVLMTNSSSWCDCFPFLHCQTWLKVQSFYVFLCVCVCFYMLCLLSSTLWGKGVGSHPVFCRMFFHLLQVPSFWNETCTDPWSCNQTNVFFGGGGVFHLKWMYVVQTFWGSIKKAVLCGNSHIPQLDLLKASRNRLAVNSSRYLQTPGRARFVLCNLVLSDDFIHKYMV